MLSDLNALISALFEDLDVCTSLRCSLEVETFVHERRSRLETDAQGTDSIPSTSIVINSFVEQGAVIGDFALIRNSVVRQGSVVGAHCQLNHSYVSEWVELPHFNNVAYSVLGRSVLFGPGAATTSRRLDDKKPHILVGGEEHRWPFQSAVGAFIGDGAKVGGGVIFNPFSVVARGSVFFPNSVISGYSS